MVHLPWVPVYAEIYDAFGLPGSKNSALPGVDHQKVWRHIATLPGVSKHVPGKPQRLVGPFAILQAPEWPRANRAALRRRILVPQVGMRI